MALFYGPRGSKVVHFHFSHFSDGGENSPHLFNRQTTIRIRRRHLQQIPPSRSPHPTQTPSPPHPLLPLNPSPRHVQVAHEAGILTWVGSLYIGEELPEHMNASRICCGRQGTRKHVFLLPRRTGVIRTREMAVTEPPRNPVYGVGLVPLWDTWPVSCLARCPVGPRFMRVRRTSITVKNR